ncbi:MAG: XdhC family protein [Omnitrophica WOR_2 bacterium]
MKDILSQLAKWRGKGETIAMATVVQTWGSSPRGVGAKMGITAQGNMTGSVSGGCVEGAVIEVGMQVLHTHQPQLLHFGVADETAWGVGLACGGTIEVFVQPLDGQLFEPLRAAIENEQPAASVTVIRGPDDLLGRELIWIEGKDFSNLIDSKLREEAIQAARSALSEGQSRRTTLPGGQVEVFTDVILPSSTIIIIGGVHISIALAKLAKVLGYRTVIVDPRRAFGSPERFSHADHLIQAWPDEALNSLHLSQSCAVAVLTHDPKLDDPALIAALSSPAYYVGALGSKSTQAKRRARLLEAGLSKTQVDRLHGPIGLDIGANNPEEIALSILAEIVAARGRP